MSGHTKMHPTEIQVVMGSNVRRYRDIPTAKLKPILTLLQGYEDGSIPWRELAKKHFEAAGGEGAFMVREARKRVGMTQMKLAEKLGMPQGNVSQLEAGRRPIGKKLAKRLSKILNVDYRVFL